MAEPVAGPRAWLLTSARARVRHLVGWGWDHPLCGTVLAAPPLLVTVYDGAATAADGPAVPTGAGLAVCVPCTRAAAALAAQWGLAPPPLQV
jgi:hypothetical protein